VRHQRDSGDGTLGDRSDTPNRTGWIQCVLSMAEETGENVCRVDEGLHSCWGLFIHLCGLHGNCGNHPSDPCDDDCSWIRCDLDGTFCDWLKRFLHFRGHLCIYTFLSVVSMQAAKGFSKKNSHQFYKRLKLWLPLSAAASVLGCCTPFGILTATTESEAFNYGASHYLILAAAIFNCANILVPTLVYPLEKDVSAVIQSSLHTSGSSTTTAYHQILNKLTGYRTELRNHGVINVLTAVLMGSWIFLQSRGSSYFLPFAWASAATVTARDLHMLLPVHQVKTAPQSSTNESSQTGREARLVPVDGTRVPSSRLQTVQASLPHQNSFAEIQPASQPTAQG